MKPSAMIIETFFETVTPEEGQPFGTRVNKGVFEKHGAATISQNAGGWDDVEDFARDAKNRRGFNRREGNVFYFDEPTRYGIASYQRVEFK